MNNAEIIEKECKELFEWISTWNYEVGGATAIKMPTSHKLAIKEAVKKMLNEARADTLAQIIDDASRGDFPIKLLEVLADYHDKIHREATINACIDALENLSEIS
jgi:capsule polysaccharide modification protein KpsS